MDVYAGYQLLTEDNKRIRDELERANNTIAQLQLNKEEPLSKSFVIELRENGMKNGTHLDIFNARRSLWTPLLKVNYNYHNNTFNIHNICNETITKDFPEIPTVQYIIERLVEASLL